MTGWQEQAACRLYDPEWWFAQVGTVEHVRATRICGACPVWVECAAHAEAHGLRWGIWGGVDRGLTPKKSGVRRCAVCGAAYLPPRGRGPVSPTCSRVCRARRVDQLNDRRKQR